MQVLDHMQHPVKADQQRDGYRRSDGRFEQQHIQLMNAFT